MNTYTNINVFIKKQNNFKITMYVIPSWSNYWHQAGSTLGFYRGPYNDLTSHP
jgi:hypothetical protein